jgi:16S rRNA (cytidine1402-2'-O)-methyltransferase
MDLLGLMRNGRDAAIISESGMPGIADPGARLVSAAHGAGIIVVPLIGPNSLILALAASGLNGQHFTFHGYLPVKPPERKAAIKRIDAETHRTGVAQLFIETPYRNEALLGDLLDHCATDTRLTIAIDLTQPGGSVVTRSIAGWKLQRPTLGKRPAVFVIGRKDR